MPIRNAIKSLRELGFTEYEAKVYAALSKMKSGVASEIHAIAGVPRSAVYGVLNNLHRRGIVDAQQTKPMRYRAISPKKALQRLRKEFIKESKEAEVALEEIYEVESDTKVDVGGVWTLSGINVYDRMMEMLTKAKKDILFVSASILKSAEAFQVFDIKKLIRSKIKKGVEVRIIDHNELELRAAEEKLGGEVRRSSTDMDGGMLIVDGSEALVLVRADLGGSLHDARAIWSKGGGMLPILKNLVEVLWNSSSPMIVGSTPTSMLRIEKQRRS
jgi:sugar-specific transcriptional regulator TrmB